jgi:hypothetical protein
MRKASREKSKDGSKIAQAKLIWSSNSGFAQGQALAAECVATGRARIQPEEELL